MERVSWVHRGKKQVGGFECCRKVLMLVLCVMMLSALTAPVNAKAELEPTYRIAYANHSDDSFTAQDVLLLFDSGYGGFFGTYSTDPTTQLASFTFTPIVNNNFIYTLPDRYLYVKSDTPDAFKGFTVEAQGFYYYIKAQDGRYLKRVGTLTDPGLSTTSEKTNATKWNINYSITAGHTITEDNGLYDLCFKEEGTACKLTCCASGAINYKRKMSILCKDSSKDYTVCNILVNVDPAAGGVATGAGVYNTGTDVVLTASAKSGYVFDGWYVGTQRVFGYPYYSFKAAGNLELTAVFKQDTAGAISVIAGYGGSIDSTTYQATASTGYVIDQMWVDGVEITEARGQTTYTPQKTPTSSVFVTFAYTVNFKSPANGTLTVVRGGQNVTSGSIVRGGDVLDVHPVADADSMLVSLHANGGMLYPERGLFLYTVGTTQPAASRSVGNGRVLSSGAEISAAFGAKGEYHAITVMDNGFGKAYASVFAAKTGENVTLSVVPNPDCHFSAWQVLSENVTVRANGFVMPGEDVALKARFASDFHTLGIIRQPADQYAVVGQKAEFSLAATGDDLIYTWYVDRNDGSGWRELGEKSAPEHVTTPAKLDNDGYRYRCLVSDPYGNESLSDTAILHVSVAPVTPKTGDSSHPAAWLIMCMLGVAGLLTLTIRRRRKA